MGTRLLRSSSGAQNRDLTGRQAWRRGAVVGSMIAFVACGETTFFASLPQGNSGISDPVGAAGSAGDGDLSGDGDTMEPPEGMGGELVPPPPGRAPRQTLRVRGGQLLGRCDEEIILRGANEMVIWSSDRDGLPWFGEMSQLGANAVRIVWLAHGSAEELDEAIGNALVAGLVPVVEMHRLEFPEGDYEPWDAALPEAVLDYWTSPDVLAVLLKYQHAIILEPAQQLGDLDEVQDWVDRYTTVLVTLREAGFRAPIALDAPFGGTRVDDFLAGASQVLEADPQENALFSTEGWSGTIEEITDRIQALSDAGIPFFVGEFGGFVGVDCDNDPPADLSPFLAKLQEKRRGWFAWSWGGVMNNGCDQMGTAEISALDMARGGLVDALNPWGQSVGIDDPNSIANTSVRVESLEVDACID